MRRFILSIFIGLMICSPPLLAGTDDDAKQSFEDGKVYFKNGQYDAAAAAFRAAYETKPTWKLLYNIAQAEAAAKKYGVALASFEQYLVEAGDELKEDRLEIVHKEISRLRNLVGVVQIETTNGAEIVVDGTLRGKAPIHGGIPVAAGTEHVIIVRLDGNVFREERVRVMGQQTVDIKIEAEPVIATQNPAATEDIGPDTTNKQTTPNSSASGLTIGGAVTTGLGVALVGAGIVTGLVSRSKNDKLQSNCTPDYCDPKYKDTQQTRDVTGIVSTIGFAVGAAALTAGVIMIVVGKKHRREKVAVLPLVGPRVTGVGIKVKF